ncbi:MAG: ATP-binding cassette domain-containing protein, partial [Brachybacterium tyrofermentans]
MTLTDTTDGSSARAHAQVVLEGRNLVKEYPVGARSGLLRRQQTMRAVDDVSISLVQGRVTALVGQSGSGKSTLGRMLARLIPSTSG